MSQLLTPKQPFRHIPAEKNELVALGEMQRDGVKSIQPYILGALSLDHPS